MKREHEFSAIFQDKRYEDKLYLFLQNIFHLYPEDRFHTLIKQNVTADSTDQAIYETIQGKLSEIKPFLADLTYALPALFKQKKEIVRQTMDLLGDVKSVKGYVEIGSTGRYVSKLKDVLSIQGDIFLVNDKAPGYSPADLMERGRIAKIGKFIELRDYEPFSSEDIKDSSIELVTCYIGLHHIKLDKLKAFIDSIRRIVAPGGWLILRDHNCTSTEMKAFVSLIHTVFNLGLKESWQFNSDEFRHFRSIDEWVEMLAAQGFRADSQRLVQAHDPSDNVLMKFKKA